MCEVLKEETRKKGLDFFTQNEQALVDGRWWWRKRGRCFISLFLSLTSQEKRSRKEKIAT